MATPTENCVIKSVTLAPNEPFNLPAGAEILSATDINSLSSTCPLPTNLEEPACYAIQIQESISDGGDAAYNDVIITGVTVSGIHYPFPTNINPPNNTGTPTSLINDFIDRLDQVGLGGLLTDWSGYQNDIPNTGDAAMVTLLCFKTPPSIGDNLSFSAYGDQDGSAPNVPIIIPVLTSAVMLSQYLGGGAYDDFVNACGCR